MTVKALCVTEDPDRPTLATFVGLSRSGIDVSVVSSGPIRDPEALTEAGVRIIDMELRGRIDASFTQALRAELESGGYDILHVLGNRALQNGLVATKGLPIRIVAYRGIVGNVNFLNPIAWKRFLNPRIDRIICVADAIRNHFLQMQPAFLRIPEERLVTIHKGHDLDWYTDEPADLTELGIPEGAFVIGCVANYRPRKGIEHLVTAVAELPDSWDAHLILVGNMESPKLDRAIAASGAEARIHRTGYRADAPALSAACDVFVMPSVKREGLARSLIEAMAYRVPPVATDSGGSPELVVDEQCGLIVPAGDAGALSVALRRLYEDPSLRQRLGEAARERIRTNFRIEDTVSKTVELYRGLVEESSAA